jgi:hypothetical protein
VIQRKTQTPEYWLDLNLGPGDLEFLHTTLLDAGKPLSTSELAELLVGERCRREEAQLRSELARGTIYQPAKTFAVSDKVVFPTLDFRLGEVVELRPGENPEYGDFDVITVDFGPDRRRRSYAARLAAPHKLNQAVPDLAASANLAPPAELLKGIAAAVPEALAQSLAQRAEFARFEDRWLSRDLLADIHVGHLNIAEAIIEMRGAAVETGELAKEMDLPIEVQPEVALFSLQSVLAADGRFDQVGSGEARKWFLLRLEPAEALGMPEPLHCDPIPFDRGVLPPTLQQLEWELDDEWSDFGPGASAIRTATPSATILLAYPHMVAGTLPLNRHSRPFFPAGLGDRTMFTLIDGRWGQRFPAWAVQGGRYVAGLRAWYEKHKLPAGAYISLERRDGSDEILIDFRPKRMRREWTRWAHAVDGRLDIQLRKQEVACEYDELMIIGDDQPAEMARLRTSPAYRNMPLAELVHEVFVDLAGLSQQGAVNARTVYSALNVVRRCPPGPVLQCLATDLRYQAVGDDNYRLAA